MPNWLTKRNENWTVLQNYNSNTRVSTTYLRLRPSYLYKKDDDPPSSLYSRSSAVQLNFTVDLWGSQNCCSCRTAGYFWGSEGRLIGARSSRWESRGMSQYCGHPSTKSAVPSYVSLLLLRCLLFPFFHAKTWNHNALVTWIKCLTFLLQTTWNN